MLRHATTRVVTVLVFWAMGSGIGVNPWSRLGRVYGRHFLLTAEHGRRCGGTPPACSSRPSPGAWPRP